MSKETIQQLIERHVIDNSGQWNHEADEAWILAGQGQFKITREEFNTAADRLRGKPDWSELPAKAEWLAQDRCGTWKPMQGRKPTIEEGSYWITDQHYQPQPRGTVIGDWRNTLERRPEQSISLEADRFGIMPPVNKNEVFSMAAPAKPWFEAGELPKAGECCEYKFQNPAVSWQIVQVNYISEKHAILTILDDGKECHADGFKAADFRPVRTDKERAIEFALSKIHNGMNRHAAPYIIEQLYDAGLLRLPDQK